MRNKVPSQNKNKKMIRIKYEDLWMSSIFLKTKQSSTFHMYFSTGLFVKHRYLQQKCCHIETVQSQGHGKMSGAQTITLTYLISKEILTSPVAYFPLHMRLRCLNMQLKIQTNASGALAL
jgi:hypothetical protein